MTRKRLSFTVFSFSSDGTSLTKTTFQCI